MIYLNFASIILSFGSKNFKSNLHSCLKSGLVLLVENIDDYDAILDPIVQQDYTNSEGIMYVRILDQAVSFSPSFRLILYTNNQKVII